MHHVYTSVHLDVLKTFKSLGVRERLDIFPRWSKEDLERIDLWPVSWNLLVRFMGSSDHASQHTCYCTCIWAFWNHLQASLTLAKVNHCISSSAWLFQHKAPKNCAVNLITCGSRYSCFSTLSWPMAVQCFSLCAHRVSISSFLWEVLWKRFWQFQ